MTISIKNYSIKHQRNQSFSFLVNGTAVMIFKQKLLTGILFLLFHTPLLAAEFRSPETGVVCHYYTAGGAIGISSGPETTDDYDLALEACTEVAQDAGGSNPYLFNKEKCTFTNASGYLIRPDRGCFPQAVCLINNEYKPVDPNSLCVAEDIADENMGCSKNSEGNPCNVATGNKHQAEVDFSYGDLSYQRFYNSLNLTNLGYGNGWQSNHTKRLLIADTSLVAVSKTGRGENWERQGNGWVGDADSDISITETDNGFQLTYQNSDQEFYDQAGNLLKTAFSRGSEHTYDYDQTGKLSRVTNNYGLSIQFIYDDGLISLVIDPEGNKYEYEYDSRLNLTTVTYPDQTNDISGDNPQRIYLYQDNVLKDHLTGIIDENGDRYATWAYDSNGKAILSKHAETTTQGEGQETFEFEHNYQAEVE